MLGLNFFSSNTFWVSPDEYIYYTFWYIIREYMERYWTSKVLEPTFEQVPKVGHLTPKTLIKHYCIIINNKI